MLCSPSRSEEAPFFCSKRAFQTQFRRWNFPSKQRPAYKNDRLVARVKELWEKNLAQREMLRVLNDEDGFDIKPRELMRVRTKNGWLLRVPNASADGGDGSAHRFSPDGNHHGGDGDQEGSDDGDEEMGSGLTMDTTNSAATSHGNSDMNTQDSDGPGGTLVPSAGSKRSRRRARQDAQSSSIGGSNRFPSEMTIDEARDILNLETPTYRTLRTNFQRICQEDGLSRKTEAGPDRWAEAKHRLVGSSTALQRSIWTADTLVGAAGNSHTLEQRQLALDVICTDVTKRLRTLETRMTLGDAKAVLGVNPAESREMRAALHAVLSEAQFVSKSDATPQQWENLKRRWGQQAPLVGEVLDDQSGSEDVKLKIKALETVASDVMKRLRDQRSRSGSKRWSKQTMDSATSQQSLQQTSNTSQSSPATTHDQMDLADSLTGSNFDDMSEVSQMTFGSPGSDSMHMPLGLPQASALAADASQQSNRSVLGSMATAMQLGSSAMGSALLLAPGNQATFMSHQQPYYGSVGATASGSSHAYQPSPSQQSLSGASASSSRPACAIYLRLHPSSSFLTDTSLWVATLGSHSVDELREAAVAKFPGAACVRIEGIIKDGKGGELPLQIEHEQELAAYLSHMQGVAPTFNVQLVWKGT